MPRTSQYGDARELLLNSLDWYRSVLGEARATAARQGYPGARWPKQTGPDGRESPSDIGSLLAWQQPHIIHLLELVWQASTPDEQKHLVTAYGEIVSETATFMSAFAEERDGTFHLGAPIMPAQEFYDARTTTDPTFELAYWWWGLEVAQQWRTRAAAERAPQWQAVQDRLAAPFQDGDRYAAVASREPLRRDDHPSLLMALGVVPPTPIIDPTVMHATLLEVWETWDWPTAWGWDFPVMAMTAARLGEPGLALNALLRDEEKNRYTAVGHNPQIRGILPLYLPGNGSLLLAVALLAQDDAAGFTLDGWSCPRRRIPAVPRRRLVRPRPRPRRRRRRRTGDPRPQSRSNGSPPTRPSVNGSTTLSAGRFCGDSSRKPEQTPKASAPLKSVPLGRLSAMTQGAMPESAIEALVAAAQTTA